MSIVFENVTKSYEKVVLDNLTLNIESGKITALMGASGRGKTTVLRLLASLEKAERGKISVKGKTGYLFQEPRLFPTLTALENVMLVCDDRQKAKKALALSEAAELAGKLPSEMSGGEKQRVAIARLVAYGGDVWLLDEAFSALDKETKARVIENLVPLMKERTVIMVTHSSLEARLCDRIIEL